MKVTGGKGFKLYWRRKSQARMGRPPTSPEIIALIEEMAINNRTWRAGRVKGELLKLGIVIDKDTVKKYMNRARKGLPPRNQGQTWATFLKNHAWETWACDFLQTYDLFFRVVFVYFIIELGSRRIEEEIDVARSRHIIYVELSRANPRIACIWNLRRQDGDVSFNLC